MKSLLIKLSIKRWNDSSNGGAKDDVIEGEEIHSLLLDKINLLHIFESLFSQVQVRIFI